MITPMKSSSIRRIASLDAMKDEELDYWLSRPAHERLAEGARLSLEAYGLEVAPRLQKTIRRIKHKYVDS